jgi:hypothetical protein
VTSSTADQWTAGIGAITDLTREIGGLFDGAGGGVTMPTIPAPPSVLPSIPSSMPEIPSWAPAAGAVAVAIYLLRR